MNYNTIGGIPAIRRLEIINVPRKIRPLDANELRRRHESGESIKTLSTELSVSRGAVSKRILDAGGIIRSQREATNLAVSQHSPEWRMARVQGAHQGRRDKRSSFAEKCKRAQRRATAIGFGERELIEALRTRGHEVEGQWPCGPYNIDIRFGPIAVELGTSTWNLGSSAFFAQRIEYLRNHGLSTVVCQFRNNRIDAFLGNLDYIITFLERAAVDPTLRRKNWMIRCRLKRFTRGRNELGQLTSIPTPVSYFHILSEI